MAMSFNMNHTYSKSQNGTKNKHRTTVNFTSSTYFTQETQHAIKALQLAQV